MYLTMVDDLSGSRIPNGERMKCRGGWGVDQTMHHQKTTLKASVRCSSLALEHHRRLCVDEAHSQGLTVSPLLSYSYCLPSKNVLALIGRRSKQLASGRRDFSATHTRRCNVNLASLDHRNLVVLVEEDKNLTSGYQESRLFSFKYSK